VDQQIDDMVTKHLIPAEIPRFFSWISIVLSVATAFTWVYFRNLLIGALRIAFYLLVPSLLWLARTGFAAWIEPQTMQVYNLSFVALAMSLVLTLKFTRRRKGFKATPLDFLILVIALVVPYLPDPTIRSFDMGLLATQIIVSFFSFEVLVGELRGNIARLTIATMTFLLIVAARGLI